MSRVCVGFAVGVVVVGAVEATCKADILDGIDCYGDDISHHSSASVSECCSSCESTEDCSAFSYAKDQQVCYLKRLCSNQEANSEVTAGIVSATQPVCPASFLEKVDCYGDDISQQAADSAEECCSACDATSGCAVFSFGEGVCYLKNACSDKQINSNRTSGIIESYSVSKGSFDVQGYECANRSPETLIFYPGGKGPFPVVTFGHGMGGGIDVGEDAVSAIAAVGLIVLAPGTAGSNEVCSSFEWKDMLLALSTAKASGSQLHPALVTADWSRTGIWGYSMGGKSAPTAAVQPGYNIKAMLAMHGARNTSKLNVPAMFTTGSADTLEGPSIIKPQFEADSFAPKVYANLKGATHTEPIDHGRLNIWGARFLGCHIGERSRQCDLIYGSGAGTLCVADDFAECIVVPASSSPALLI